MPAKRVLPSIWMQEEIKLVYKNHSEFFFEIENCDMCWFFQKSF